VAPEPNRYQGKEVAVRRCENTFAVGDSVGMCRFNTRLFNSPSLPDLGDFARQLATMTGIAFDAARLNEIGRNITGLERLLNFRLGLRARDDTLPRRWFDEAIDTGPFKGEKVDREEFEAMKQRFYAVTGLNAEGIPALAWHEALARVVTGFAIRVELPRPLPGAPEKALVVDQPVADVAALRAAVRARLPEAREALDDATWNVAVNDAMVLSGERGRALACGDRVAFVPIIGGG
jgi:aldehyde:ferredoxin oxidoreductase